MNVLWVPENTDKKEYKECVPKTDTKNVVKGMVPKKNGKGNKGCAPKTDIKNVVEGRLLQ